MILFAAFASEKGGASLDHAWTLILLQLILVVGVAQFAGMVAMRFKQPKAVGEMIAGLALGPSLLGWIFPEFYQKMIAEAPRFPLSVLSQIGLIFLLFQIGMEFEFSQLRSKSHRRTVSWVWISGVLIPLILGISLGWISAPYLHPQGSQKLFAIFMGVALSITALPILGRILIEWKLEKSQLGVIAISCAAMDDVIAWILLAIATGIAQSTLDWNHELLRWSGLFFYGMMGWFFVRPQLKKWIPKWIGTSPQMPFPLLGLILSLLFCSALCTQALGIFAIFGAFYLGVLLHDQPLFVSRWRDGISPLVMVFFVPIFFTFTGLRANIPGLSASQDWFWLIGVILIATLGKWGGCYLAARWSGLNHPFSMALGVLMNTRALMELVVANVALDLGAISQKTFTMLVIMAITSTVMTGPILHRLLRRNPELRN
ncbi:MAG: cation:proton antiporter [Verrucomicrobiota bacterium]